MGALLPPSRLAMIDRGWLARAADAAAVLGVVGAVLATQLPPPGDIMVVAGVIVRPFRVAAACFTITVAAWVVRWRLLRDVPGERRGRMSRALRRALTVGLTCASLVALTVTGFEGLLSPSYAVDPPGPGGCRVYVAVREGMMSSSGSIRVLKPGHISTVEVSRYEADDEFPMRQGQYSLTWHGEVATFRVWGAPVNPVVPDAHTISCDR